MYNTSFVLQSVKAVEVRGRSVDTGQQVAVSQQDATEFYFSTPNNSIK
ncbi:hypothetical protein [Coxiella-like endosymbiont]|nr:hypothetical protein [Coxiella-like endosymbiont]